MHHAHKRAQKRKEDCKEKIRKNRNCTFPNPEGPVDRLYWAFQILEVPVKNWGWKGSQKYTVSLERGPIRNGFTGKFPVRN
jgi:hypothetical protein